MWFTFGLVMVGFLQVGALFYQARLINRSICEMAQSNTITKEATELTRQSFILANRPKIVVRNVGIENDAQVFAWRATPERGESVAVKGTLRMINIGNSTAHVVAWQCRRLLAQGLAADNPLPLLTETLPRPIDLPPGKYATMCFPTDQQEELTTTELFQLWARGVQGGPKICIVGEIVYRDDLGNVRTTWFCRQRSYGETRFVPVDNADYESAD